MAGRPNFYQLLDLDPAVEDWGVIEARLMEKKRQWSKDRTMGNPRRKREAARALGLVEEIESTLKDPEARRGEARAEEKRRKAEKEKRFRQLDNAIAVLKSGGSCDEAAFEKLCKQFQGTFTSQEVERRLRSAGVRVEKGSGGERPKRRKKERIETSLADTIRRNLDHLGLETLYDFLGLKPQSSPKALHERATEIYRENQRLGKTTPEASVQNELAGIGQKIFRSDEEKAKYDAHLAVEAMDGLKSSIEMAGYDSVLRREEMNTLVKQARERGVTVDDAREYLEEYAAKRKWGFQRDVELPAEELRRCGFCSTLATRASASHCARCGRPLVLPCPKCGADNPSENSACKRCGYRKFDVFLSHNSRDKLIIRELADALEERSIKVWLDERELIPGRPWLDALEEVIRETKTAAVLVGKDGLGPWEDHEMQACLRRFVKVGTPIIPVLLPGAPRDLELPFFLETFTWVDMRAGITSDTIYRLECGIRGINPGQQAGGGSKESARERSGPLRSEYDRIDNARRAEIRRLGRQRQVVNRRVYGVDLGTTYSCIACVDEHGKPTVVENAEGELTTPSVVCFEREDNVVVGYAAKEVAAVLADQCVSAVKRAMGDPTWEREFFGQTYKPQDISSFIVRKLVGDAEQLTGEKIDKVVITCPAYFGIKEKEATKQAGVLAGLEVLYVIPEPTAAALAYGMEQEGDQVVLVYDLGGGTFDATVLEIHGNAINIISTRGDHELGGKDWDDAIVAYFTQCFEAETGTSADALLEDMETYQELLNAAERCKKSLTTLAKVPVPVRFEGERVKIELTRKKFNDLTSHLLTRTLELTKAVIQAAQEKEFVQIDRLLLVGGSSYMPQVMEALQGRFPFEVNLYEPSQAIAKGAAIFGFRCYLDEQIKISGIEEIAAEEVGDIPVMSFRGLAEKKINNVTSKSFGFFVEQGDDRTIALNLIKVDDSVPCTATHQIHTSQPDLSEIELEVVENLLTKDQVEIDDCKQVGTAVLAFDRPLPKGSPIEITFELGPDGLLKLHGRDQTTGYEIEAEFKTDAIMTREAVEKSRRRNLSLRVS